MPVLEDYGKSLEGLRPIGRSLSGIPVGGTIKPPQKNPNDLILGEVQKRLQQIGPLIKAGKQVELLRRVIDAGPTAPGTLDEARRRGWMQ